MSLNTIKVPTLEQLGEVAAELGFAFTAADLATHHESLGDPFASRRDCAVTNYTLFASPRCGCAPPPGLAVVDAIAGLRTLAQLRVRLGIASGLVVVGDLIGQGAVRERDVIGETPTLAARLQALAPPGTVVIADSTRRQIGALFEVEDLGPQSLAGFVEPQRAWR
jgi:class 3 adenylate cyclase